MKTVHVLVGILICGLLVQGAFAQNRAKPMTNDDVISMVKAGLPENIVISAIGAQETNFDNSAPALVQLTKEGVSTRIITIMLLRLNVNLLHHRLVSIRHLHHRFHLPVQRTRNNRRVNLCQVNLLRFLKIQTRQKVTTKRTALRSAAEAASSTS